MDNQIKILVLCGGKFAFPALQSLALQKYLVGIAIGAGEKSAVSLLTVQSQQAGIPFLEISDRSELTKLNAWIETIRPDAVFCVCFPFLLPQTTLDIVPNRFVNFHTGPLPEYRGPAPIFEVLRSMEKETALSVHLMNNRFDEGAVIVRERVPIDKGETFGSLSVKLSSRTAMTVLNIAQMLQFGTQMPAQNQDAEKACYYPKPESNDTYIRWHQMHSREIECLINACNPWNQGADTSLAGKSFKIVSAESHQESHNSVPGTILKVDETGGLHIACIEQERIIARIISSDRGIETIDNFIAHQNIIGQCLI